MDLIDLDRSNQDQSYTPLNFVLLVSKPGCQSQMAHSNYIPLEDLNHGRLKPLNAIIALEPGTKLHVWSGSMHLISNNEKHRTNTKIKKDIISLHHVDVLIFCGDLVHTQVQIMKMKILDYTCI